MSGLRQPGAALRLLEEDRHLIAPDFKPIETATTCWRKKVRISDMQAGDLGQAIVSLPGLDIEFAHGASRLARAARLAVEGRHPSTTVCTSP